MQIKSHIADDLRRRADDPARLAEALEQERQTADRLRETVDQDPCELNESHLGRELSRLADHLLLADEPEEALGLKEEAAGIWQRLGRDKAAYLAELDAAEILFETGRRHDALAELDRLVAASVEDAYRVYRDFVLEVRGRCRARLGDTKGAIDDLRAALELRKERGSARQIDQTQRLLQRVASL